MVDKIDITKATARANFIERLSRSYPAVNVVECERKLTDIAAKLISKGDRASTELQEWDAEFHVVRSERFILPEISGLTTSVMTLCAGHPIAKWMTYLHWADGRRERITSASSIPLSEKSILYCRPKSPKPRRRVNEDPSAWQQLRDGLHCLALDHGQVWLSLCNMTDVCPEMSGRDFELWQPLLALAKWFQDAGVSSLYSNLMRYAKYLIELSRDDQTPDCDLILLRVLAQRLQGGYAPTCKEVLSSAKMLEEPLFKSWSEKAVSTHLGRYGLRTTKRNGRRIYAGVSLEDLKKIEINYGLDLEILSQSRASLRLTDRLEHSA